MYCKKYGVQRRTSTVFVVSSFVIVVEMHMILWQNYYVDTQYSSSPVCWDDEIKGCRGRQSCQLKFNYHGGVRKCGTFLDFLWGCHICFVDKVFTWIGKAEAVWNLNVEQIELEVSHWLCWVLCVWRTCVL